MELSYISGLLYILIGGTFSGIFAIPFKKNINWNWENNWFIWSFVALLIAPWIIAIATVPSLLTVLSSDKTCLLLVISFGLIWGYGAILFGKGIDYLGVSLGQPIMLGLINSVGTLMPIILKNPEKLVMPEGVKIIIGVGIIISGIVFYSISGHRREKAVDEINSLNNKRGAKSFKKGIVICALAGVFGPMINFAFVFGEPIQQHAQSNGASSLNAGNAIWCIVLSAGFIINILECIRLFRKNKSFHIYDRNLIKYIFPIFAGIMWFLSIMFYGMGGNSLGENGASVGWAIMQSTAIIASGVSGIIFGEWRGTSFGVKYPMYIGLLLLVVGVVVIAW